MRLVRLWSEPEQIDPIEFKPGLNVIIAEKSVNSGEKDSTNNLGKSAFAKVVDFCLLAKTEKMPFVRAASLQHLTMCLEFSSGGEAYVVARSFANPDKVILTTPDGQRSEYSVAELRPRFSNMFLGDTADAPFHPSFRQLMQYLIRDEKEGYGDPFESFRRMPALDRSTMSLFLLGLNYQLPKQLDQLIKRKEKLEQVASGYRSSLESEGFSGKMALLAQRAEVEQELQGREQELRDFRVLPEYRSLQTEVAGLAQRMASLRNENFVETRRLEGYRKLLEGDPVTVNLEATKELYMELKVRFPELLRKELDEIIEFQRGVASAERRFLEKQLRALEDRIRARQQAIQTLDERRSAITQSLAHHGALDEYQRLSGLLSSLRERLARLDAYKGMYEQLERLEAELSGLKLSEEQLKNDIRESLHQSEERVVAINMLFSEAYRAIYDRRAYLSVSFNKTAFSFSLTAENPDEFKGQGKGHTGIFCYDIALLQANSTRDPFSHFLLHDGVFTGVDPRHVKSALDYVSKKLEGTGLQYICTLRSDKLQDPHEFDAYVRQRLFDTRIEGKFFKAEY